jgi:LysR family glycine cleavage system transcriptional activator
LIVEWDFLFSVKFFLMEFSMRLPLNALRTFEAVASRLSFKKGADALHVSPAAVSSQIRLLEDHLGQPLLHRQGRNVTLTEAGQTLLPGVQRGLTELTQAVNAIQEDRTGGVLNVSMVPSFLQKWLTPRLADFYRTYDSIDLRINADSAPVSFSETDFHAAIRFGRGHWPALQVSKLLDEWTLAVCSPEMLKDIGPIERASDLTGYTLLQGEDEGWATWFNALGGGAVVRKGPRFDDSVSIVVAAEQGLGIGLARWSLVAAELASGRLVRCFPVAVKSVFAYYFVAPHHYFDMPKVAIFRDWLEECCRAFPTPDSD